MNLLHPFVFALAGLAFQTASAEPATYSIDPTHTLPRLEYTHLGFSVQSSRFNKASGTITIDRAARTGSADIAIDARSIGTGVPQLDANIRGIDILDAANHPTIAFKSTRFAFRGDELASVSGDLSIKGVTRPVELTVQSFTCKPHPRLGVEACGATATVTIKRSDFGVSAFIPLVSDELRLIIPIEAIKQ
jgi:polyisoprenoid-binding protein YceI